MPNPVQGGQGHYLPLPAQAASPAIIKAHGEVKTRIGVLWFMGVVCGLLIVGGFAVFFQKPEIAKDVWVIIGPIISAAVTGTVGFLAGERGGKGD